MDNKEKRSCLIGIIVLVVGGLLLTMFNFIIPQFFNFVLRLLGNVWQFLSSTTLLPNSIFCLLIVLAIPTLIRIVQVFVRNKTNIATNEPSIRRYKQDKFFELDWRWSWIQENNFPSEDIWCFCPNCQTRLIDENPTNSFASCTVFVCETCDFKSMRFDSTLHDVLGKINRQVERRINTGEWKAVVKNENSIIN